MGNYCRLCRNQKLEVGHIEGKINLRVILKSGRRKEAIGNRQKNPSWEFEKRSITGQWKEGGIS